MGGGGVCGRGEKGGAFCSVCIFHNQKMHVYLIIIIFYMDTQDHAIYHVWIHFIPTSLYPRREKAIWSELELNPGPLASQATTLTTRPWLLGQTKEKGCGGSI